MKMFRSLMVLSLSATVGLSATSVFAAVPAKSYAAASGSAQASQKVLYKAKATRAVYIHKKAYSSSAVTGTVKKGETVSVLAKAPYNWLKVKAGSKTGYVYGEYLKKSSSSTSVKKPAKKTTKKTTTSAKKYKTGIVTYAVKFRTAPTTDSKVLFKLPVGAKVTVLAKEPYGWLKVKAKHKGSYKTGYVYSPGFVKVK